MPEHKGDESGSLRQDVTRVKAERRLMGARKIPRLAIGDNFPTEPEETDLELELSLASPLNKDATGAQPPSASPPRRKYFPELHAQGVKDEDHIFIAANGLVVVDIHADAGINLRISDDPEILSRAKTLAESRKAKSLIVVHGHRSGTAWKEKTHQDFGAKNCEAWRGHPAITVVNLRA